MTPSRNSRPILVVEDDPFLRLIQVILDPSASEERRAAFRYFVSHDLPDFEGWCQEVRRAAADLNPSDVRLVSSQEELRAALPGASAVVVEALSIGSQELAAADQLVAVQKFGSLLRNIDQEACEKRGVPVLTQRRRANIACAEHTIALMLTLARKLHRLGGRISLEQLSEAGFEPGQFDRRHTAMSGWPRVSGLRILYESTLGIIGLGEIGRELALRIAPFGLRVLYYQRKRLSADDERSLGVEFASLERLLGESDWVSVQLPLVPETRGFLNRDRLAQMKRGAFLVNTSRAEIVDREALLEALASGHLGGFGLDPLYEEPGQSDDPLLMFENVFLTPHTAAQPRFNALTDIQEMVVRLSTKLQK